MSFQIRIIEPFSNTNELNNLFDLVFEVDIEYKVPIVLPEKKINLKCFLDFCEGFWNFLNFVFFLQEATSS